jgi:K+ transporter
VYGVLSLIFWSDHDDRVGWVRELQHACRRQGRGGIMSLRGLLLQGARLKRNAVTAGLITLGVLGASCSSATA